MRLLFLTPRKAYERVGVTHAFGRPIGFAILVGWPGILAATLWNIAFRTQMQEWLQLPPEDRYDLPAFVKIGIALAAPVWLPLLLLIAAAFLHLFLWMVGGAKKGFVDTFRVLCYAQISTLACVVPICGELIGGLWHVVLQVVGLSAVHRIGTGRAIFAIVLPLLLCCGCIAVLLSIFGAAWLSTLRGGH